MHCKREGEKGLKEGERDGTLEAVNVEDAVAGQLFGFESSLEKSTLRVVRCNDAEISVQIVSPNEVDDRFDFL